MVRVRSRGGADTSALSLRERATVSANFRFAVAHVAEALSLFLESRSYRHFDRFPLKLPSNPFGTLGSSLAPIFYFANDSSETRLLEESAR